MLIYTIIFFLSAGGIVAIAFRHQSEIQEFRFATFMENMQRRGVEFWYAHAHGRLLTLLEKYLRMLRIQALKIEHALFRAAHGVRGINERTGNGNGNNSKEIAPE